MVGKNLKLDEEDIINNEFEKLILNKFAKNSEIIEFENMKKKLKLHYRKIKSLGMKLFIPMKFINNHCILY